uniref:Proliferating cell nuclear antigen PCNA N-terminal domain-containing protein n=1 Tax=viral metagenome TaxID=1070528 RepID=A0A6C0LXF1_9ZZZZ
MNTTIFRCKTDNACYIKTMGEIISNIIKLSFWEIGEDGITMSMFDQTRKMMVTIKLDAVNFNIYEFNNPDTIFIGMNSGHFHKMLKSVKKKDTIEFFIESPNTTILNIKTIPKDHSRVTISSIKIQSVQNIDVVNPDGYGKSIIIQSGDFHKMIKDLSMIDNNKITIVDTKNGVISLSADADGIMKREILFGEEGIDSGSQPYTSFFELEQFSRISKMSALSDCIHIFPPTDELPCKITSMIGTIGTIAVYIKSVDMVQHDD